ncbi:hypothetical protein A2U01_0080929, partial [Trifolium medium]|nr:hypothetical protein [Trifolium medium]
VHRSVVDGSPGAVQNPVELQNSNEAFYLLLCCNEYGAYRVEAYHTDHGHTRGTDTVAVCHEEKIDVKWMSFCSVIVFSAFACRNLHPII